MATARIGFFFLICFLWFTPLAARQAGLFPADRDGFETGDWQNFRPHYIGNASDFIRPRFDVTDEDPISGDYSLRWTGGEREHKWLMLSNAFQMNLPVRVSVTFRVDSDGASDGEWSSGLRMMESHDLYSGLNVKNDSGTLLADGTAETSDLKSSHNILPGNEYRITIELDEAGLLSGTIADLATGNTIYHQTGKTITEPEAIAMFVHTPAGSAARIVFDDVEVESGEYFVVSDEWTRAPMPNYVVLPRLPDVTQEEGNWVGGHSVMRTDDGTYHMWYRIRDNNVRGRGYGYATSKDGLNWEKYEANPVFQKDPSKQYASNEKISVLKVDDIFHGWYTVENDGLWIINHITSEDGINWSGDQEVINDQMCKDADVIYLNGTFYLYCIGPTYTDIAVHTSENGIDWERKHVYEMGTHRHLAAYYDKKNQKFALYPTAGGRGVSYAVSEDGIRFEPFVQTWTPSAVGLDDWERAGITYFSFLRNQHGHIEDADVLPVYYQARNTYDNNIPGWLYHGGERVVLAGKFNGMYLNLPIVAQPDGSYHYKSFPFGAVKADGLEFYTSYPAEILVTEWEKQERVTARGTLKTEEITMVQVKASGLKPENRYLLNIEGQSEDEIVSDENGDVLLRTVIGSEKTGRELSFTVLRQDD